MQKNEFKSKLAQYCKRALIEYIEAFDEKTKKEALLIIKAQTGLSESWLHSLSLGRGGEPSAIKLETLYTFLTGKTINVE